jgi:NAD(P)-dependent dehydrogenase (short-subunit alcohol dehydrogenase family)
MRARTQRFCHRGITVNTVSPGITAMNGWLTDNEE